MYEAHLKFQINKNKQINDNFEQLIHIFLPITRMEPYVVFLWAFFGIKSLLEPCYSSEFIIRSADGSYSKETYNFSGSLRALVAVRGEKTVLVWRACDIPSKNHSEEQPTLRWNDPSATFSYQFLRRIRHFGSSAASVWHYSSSIPWYLESKSAVFCNKFEWNPKINRLMRIVWSPKTQIHAHWPYYCLNHTLISESIL